MALKVTEAIESRRDRPQWGVEERLGIQCMRINFHPVGSQKSHGRGRMRVPAGLGKAERSPGGGSRSPHAVSHLEKPEDHGFHLKICSKDQVKEAIGPLA